jgi:hypothetical protein
MVYQFMQEHQDQYSMREMAGLFRVSTGAYYKWAKQGASGERSKGDAELLELIREIVHKHYFRYGSRRMREAPRQD